MNLACIFSVALKCKRFEERIRKRFNDISSLKFNTFEKNILAMKQMGYTAIIEKSDDGYYVGQVQEIPESIAQGKTIEELNQNLLDDTDGTDEHGYILNPQEHGWNG
jgi:hypothetical protein